MPAIKNEASLLLMLGQAIKDPETFSRLVSRLRPEHFRPNVDRWQCLVWTATCEYYLTNNNTLPGFNALKYTLMEHLLRLPGVYTGEELSAMETFLKDVFADNEPLLTPDSAVNIAQMYIDEYFVKQQIRSDTPERASDIVSRLSSLVSSTRIESYESANIFDVDDTRITDEVFTQPEPTGAAFFDTLLGGGLRNRDVILLAAPSKGGKTTAALTVAVSVARTHRHVVLASYEQKAVPELRDLAWSCATGIPRSKIFGVHLNRMDENVRRSVLACAPMAPYLRMLDFSMNTRGNRGIADVRQFVQSETQAGRRPFVVLVDWMSLMARRVLANSPNQRISDWSAALRSSLLDQVSQARSMAIEFDTRVVLVQQLSGDAAGRRNDAPAEATDTMDCKSLHLECTGAVIMGRKNEQGYVRISTPIVRHAANTEITARIMGDCCRVEMVDADEAAGLDTPNEGVRRVMA